MTQRLTAALFNISFLCDIPILQDVKHEIELAVRPLTGLVARNRYHAIVGSRTVRATVTIIL